MINQNPKTRKTIKLLYAASEAVPFAYTGGLGEVASSLPKALVKLNDADVDCRVIMPLYGDIPDEYRREMHFLGSGGVKVGWRSQYMGVFSLKLDGVIYYFIDNEYYFKRDEGLYGYYDDAERFIYFSKAVFESIKLTDFSPDIIHANDWQGALIPVYQTAVYKRKFMNTLFTIHNVEYQGVYGKELFDEVLDIPAEYRDIVLYNDAVNFMKGGIEAANRFSTVSPTYARELEDPMLAFGLDEIIRRNGHKKTGILNGIDTESYNPGKDDALPSRYHVNNMAGKAKCKRALQEEMGLKASNAPLITMITRLVPAKGIDLVVDIMDDILNQNDIRFILLGTGFDEYEAFFRGLAARHPEKFACIIDFDPKLSRRMYAGGDLFLMPSRSEACGLAQMIACRYGNIPIVRETGGLADSIQDCSLGTGNGFTFRGFSGGDLRFAIERALKLYAEPKDWRRLVRHAMLEKFGWDKAAEEYLEMYKELFSPFPYRI